MNIKKINPIVIWIVVLGVIVLVALYNLFLRKPRQVREMTYAFDIDIPGRYIGKSIDKDGRVSKIDFEVDWDYRVIWLLYTDNRSKDKDTAVEWRYPHTLKAQESHWGLDSQGNRADRKWQRRVHRQARTLILESTHQNQKGPYAFQSDFLVDDHPDIALLQPTADGEGIYVQFDLKIPAIGQVPIPESYEELFFRGTPETFQTRCKPPLKFVKGLTDPLEETAHKKVVPMAEGVFVEWYKNTVCKFSLEEDHLMNIDVLFTPSDAVALMQEGPDQEEYVIEAQRGLTLKFVEPYMIPVRIWIGKDGYGQAQVKGDRLTYAIRKADLDETKRGPLNLDWEAMPRE